MSIVSDIQTLIATPIEAVARLAEIGERITAGPPLNEHPPVAATAISSPTTCFVDGWWIHATRHPAHPARVGGPVSTFSTVVHSCDMLPNELAALIIAWTTKPGAGNAANFVIGPTAAEGVLQFVPINRNANHAGGPGHGVFVDGAGRTYHPNIATVGIEIHCAGGVRRVNGQWRLVEDGVAHGMVLPDADVIPDPQRAGRGVHRVTDYQYERLEALLHDLDQVQVPMPAGLVSKSMGEAVPSWAVPKSARVVGHVSLDPEHRSDPWGPTMTWLRAR